MLLTVHHRERHLNETFVAGLKFVPSKYMQYSNRIQCRCRNNTRPPGGQIVAHDDIHNRSKLASGLVTTPTNLPITLYDATALI